MLPLHLEHTGPPANGEQATANQPAGGPPGSVLLRERQDDDLAEPRLGTRPEVQGGQVGQVNELIAIAAHEQANAPERSGRG